MVTFIIRRLILAVFVLLLVTLVVFLIMRLLPGDPVAMYLSQTQLESMTQEQIDFTRHTLGLDRPIMTQYVSWVGGLFHGDLGNSLATRQSVADIIAKRIPVTLHLGILSLLIGTIVGIVAGVIAAVKRGSATDQIVTIISNLGITLPTFWLGIILIYIFGLKLHWLPIFGYTSPFEDFWMNTKQIIMPVFCLSIFGIAATARQTRSSILEVVRQDYIRTAWSKGLAEQKIIFKHVLKNGLIPVVTLSGMSIGNILGGAVLIETVFSIPGMGRLAVDALFGMDYPVVQAIVLISGIMVTLANLLVDISYGWMDPRVRYG